MDKKIGKVLFFILLLLVGKESYTQSIRVLIQNSQQQQISQAEIGIPFLLQLFVEDLEPREQPKGLEHAENCTVQMYGTTQSSSYINGKQTQKIIFTYVITPEKKGVLHLGPISITGQDGVELRSDKIVIPVGDIAEPIYKGKLPYLLVTDAAQKEVYIGQKVTVFLRFCYTQGFEGLSIESSPFRGAHCGYQEQNLQQSTVKLGDHEYACKQIYFELYPQELGTLVIPQFKASFMPEQNQQQGMGNLFNLFGFSNAKIIQSYPRGIDVKPLPASSEYPGVTAIGSFDKITFSLQQQNGQVGEGIVAKMVVEGDGNLEIVKAPVLTMPDGIHFYEGNNSIERVDANFSRKTFEWILQADTPGVYTIPSQTFTYFDLNTQSYQQLHSKPTTLKIDGVVQQPKQIDEHRDDVVSPLPEKEVVLSSPSVDEITYVHVTGLSSKSIEHGLFSRLLIWVIGVLLSVLLMVFGGWLVWPYVLRLFFVQSLGYRWLFWKYSRTQNVEGVYQLFEHLASGYGFGLQSDELRKCFHDLNLSDEQFENWKNFVDMLLEFNFASKKTSEDRMLAFHLAKQWFPIILSCCKSFYTKR